MNSNEANIGNGANGTRFQLCSEGTCMIEPLLADSSKIIKPCSLIAQGFISILLLGASCMSMQTFVCC
jgi:hypothetical protein